MCFSRTSIDRRFLLGALACSLLACTRPPAAVAPVPADAGGLPAAASTRVVMAWPSSVEGRYRVAWKVEQRVSLEHVDTGGGVVTSSVDFSGVLGLRESQVQGRRVLRVRVLEVETGVLRMEDGKQRGDVDLHALAGSAFHAELTPDGKHAAVLVPSGTEPLVQQALVLMASHLAVVTPVGPVTGANTWASTHATPSGEVMLAYRLASPAPVSLARALERGPGAPGKTTGSWAGTVQLDVDGAPVKIDDAVTLGGGGTFRGSLAESFHLERAGDVPASPAVEEPDATRTRKLTPGQSAITTSRATELKQRIGDMTRESMVRDLRLIGPDGKPPVVDAHAWRWQASGLLQADASAVRAAEAVFHEPTVTDDARNQVLDLFQSAGDDASQEALLRILSRPDVMERPRYAARVQRVSLLNRPNPATREWAEKRFLERRNKPLPVVAPFAVTFGAVVGHSTWDPSAKDDVQRGLALLLEGLAAAPDAATRDAYLQAVGNTKLPGALEPMMARAGDPDIRVRSIVARNMFAYPNNPRAMDTLHRLSVDAHPQVAVDALGSMVHLPMNPAQRARLRSDATSGRIHVRAYGTLMHVVDAWAGDVESRPILEHVRRTTNDPRTQGRANTLLQRLGTTPSPPP